MNVAGIIGRWSARHWWIAAVAWVVFVAGSYAIGNAVGLVKLADAKQGAGETGRAEAILANAHFARPASEDVLVRSAGLSVDDPAFRATVARVLAGLRAQPAVARIRAPYRGWPGLVSADRHAALIEFDLAGSGQAAADAVKPVLAAVERAARASPGFVVTEFGSASSAQALDTTSGSDLKKAEELSLPLTLVILLLAFGAMIAAGISLLLGFTAVFASFGLANVISHAVPGADSTKSVILLIGLAVGVDYALFYLKREREERWQGMEHGKAIELTAATSGQAVLISGWTVMIAMAGMFFAGSPIFTSIGLYTMIVVAAAVIGSVTVLPALLSRLGVWADKGLTMALVSLAGRIVPLPAPLRRFASAARVPLLMRGKSHESRIWTALLRPVMRRPLPAVLLAGGALAALSIPAFSMHTRLLSISDLPRSIPAVKAYEEIQAAFPGVREPARVVVQAPNVDAPRVRRAIAALETRALASGRVSQPIDVSASSDRTVARIDIPLRGNAGQTAQTLTLLRRTIIPAAVGALPGTTVAVTGQTAGTTDFNNLMKARAPIVFAFVLGLAFLILMMTFRSLVIPLKAILLNLLSVGASYGFVVLVFQHRWAESILGFRSNGAIVSWLPIFLFVILFGLSMDYHVFILTRVKEQVDHGMRTDEAVERAIRSTASTVTSAAAVMVAVFATFITLSGLDLKQLGLGLAFAVFLDATVVRGVLLPAAMKLLGEWNWWFPRWLSWLPDISIEPPATELVRLRRGGGAG